MTTEYKPYTISEIVTRIYEDNYSHFDFMENMKLRKVLRKRYLSWTDYGQKGTLTSVD